MTATAPSAGHAIELDLTLRPTDTNPEVRLVTVGRGPVVIIEPGDTDTADNPDAIAMRVDASAIDDGAAELATVIDVVSIAVQRAAYPTSHTHDHALELREAVRETAPNRYDDALRALDAIDADVCTLIEEGATRVDTSPTARAAWLRLGTLALLALDVIDGPAVTHDHTED